MRLPEDVNSILCKTADDCCTITGRSSDTARKCKLKIAHFLRHTIAEFPEVSIGAAEALRRAVSEYAQPGAVAFGFIVQHPFSVSAVEGIKTKELRSSAPPLVRVGTRFFIQESKTPTNFIVHQDVLGNAALGKNPQFIVGSVSLTGWYEIEEKDITPELAKETCLSEEGLHDALQKGYRFCWRWAAAVRFDRPIPVRAMNISPRGCVLWAKCHESPRTRLPPQAYLMARMREILASADHE